MNNSKRLLAIAVSAALAAPMAAYATNGMNLEGYGPIATGMGGASMAYDNGNAAVMNNPATLGLMDDGNRLDVALGFLGPKVNTSVKNSPMEWDSSANSFFMPAVGWTQKKGDMAYGVGMFAQGGMGTDYSESGAYGAAPGAAMSSGEAASNIANLTGMIGSFGITSHISTDQAAGGTITLGDMATTYQQNTAALEEFSEVSVGRLVFPFVKNMGKLAVGGSIDYVWAGMDLQMAMSGSMMGDMMPGGSQTAGTITGGLVNAMGGMQFNPVANTFDGSVAPPTMNDFGLSGINSGYFDFKDGSPYTGSATGAGFAGKLGFTYQVNSKLNVGGTYHSKTSMGDLKADGANVSMSVLMSTVEINSGTMMTMVAPVDMKGTITVKDFQWPQTIGLGASYQVNDKLMIAGDVKSINWSSVMKDFTMEFSADSISIAGMDMTGALPNDMTAVMYQNWDDQTVIQIGAAYQVAPTTVVRAGYNKASNPIPTDTLNYLFPAIQVSHYTLGVGHAFSKADSVDFALTMAPKHTSDMGAGAEVSMEQTNWQLMYSKKF